jgi:hypothetical protein
MHEAYFVAVFAQPQFGRDEHLGTIDAASHQSFPDLSLVEIVGSGVDEPIAIGYRDLHSTGGLFYGAWIEYTEAERWHLDAIVQGYDRTFSGHTPGSST